MALRKLIFTADDYGITPLIDDAVNSAAAKNIISAVSVLPNGKDQNGNFSVTKARILKKSFPQISIGMHFTITSGDRVCNNAKSLSRRGKRKFRGIASQHPDKAVNNDLEEELEAQIKVFEDENLEIEHFSDHHGLLSYTDKGLNTMLHVIKRYNNKIGKNVPLRNPVFISGIINDKGNCLDKSAMYQKAKLGAFIRNLYRKKCLSEMDFDFDKINKHLQKIHDNGITTTDYFIENFYASPKKETLQCIINEAKDTKYSISNPIDPNYITSEVVVHLAIQPDNFANSPQYQNELQKVRAYTGININYLTSNRVKEFEILSKNLKKFLNPIKMGVFKTKQ